MAEPEATSEIAARWPKMTARARVAAEGGGIACHTEAHELTTEVENLIRWKAEALHVLNEWTAAWVAAGRPGELGESIAAATTAEIARLKRTLDDRNEWMKDQAEQLSSLLLAIPRPLRNLIAKRADRIRGEVYTAASPTSPTGGDQ